MYQVPYSSCSRPRIAFCTVHKRRYNVSEDTQENDRQEQQHDEHRDPNKKDCTLENQVLLLIMIMDSLADSSR